MVPVFNEAPTVLACLNSLRSLRHPGCSVEVVVVDDGSTDATHEVLSAHPSLYDRLLSHEHNRGKGAAVQTGLTAATGQVVAIHDADAEYSIEDYPRLLTPFRDLRADVVFGRRSLERISGAWATLYRLANGTLSLLVRALSGLPVHDVACCLKLFRRELLDPSSLRERGFAIDPELTLRLARNRGLSFFEVPVQYVRRTNRQGKKLRWWHGFRYTWAIIRYGTSCRLARRAIPAFGRSSS